jgi:hypothetical protein
VCPLISSQLHGTAASLLSGNVSSANDTAMIASQSGSESQLVTVASALGCSLRVMDLHANALSGSLPGSMLSLFTTLVELNLAANQLSQQ